MQELKPRKLSLRVALLLIGFVVSSIVALAQDTSTKVKGIIKARSGDVVVIQTDTEPALNVHLTDSTDVGQLEGMLKARNKKMSMAALIPGLPIEVEGPRNGPSDILAQKIRFKGNDFQQAKAIQAGMHEEKQLNAEQQAELEKHNAELAKQQAQLTEHNEKIAANKAAIEANTARFGQLDDYYIYDEVTVYFANGKTAIDPKYKAPLAELAKKAESVEGYMIEVKGYASTTGSAALNQQLSQNRATNVVNFLQQQGNVPLTRMLAPGAMGETGDSKSGADEAEARKVVVRVLQNKAIAGIS
jgi:outer membrane protein OmpA-like peptidoglycan-associated protein